MNESSSRSAPQSAIKGLRVPIAGVAKANASDGAHLFKAYCATCHNPDGRTRQSRQADFRRLPPNLATGPWFHLQASDTVEEGEIHIAQIVKFGIPGTDMPGHEYLSDRDASSLALWLTQNIVQQDHLASTYTPFGENR
jgi:mono/diheme cytochrome c family protein